MSELVFNLSGCDRAECGSMNVVCIKTPVAKLARKAIAEGHDFCTPLRVMRDGTQCFKTAPLWVFARIVATEPSSGSVRMVKYRADPRFVQPTPEIAP